MFQRLQSFIKFLDISSIASEFDVFPENQFSATLPKILLPTANPFTIFDDLANLKQTSNSFIGLSKPNNKTPRQNLSHLKISSSNFNQFSFSFKGKILLDISVYLTIGLITSRCIFLFVSVNKLFTINNVTFFVIFQRFSS